MFAQIGAPAKAAEPLVEQVRIAIEKGIRLLRNEERGRGNWEHTIGAQGKPGGYSASRRSALLNSGVKADDPIIQRGLEYLRSYRSGVHLRRRLADDGLRRGRRPARRAAASSATSIG